MSNTRPSYIRTNVRPFGRFFVVCPTTKIDASFLEAQNSNEDIEVVAESNGWIGFFLENEIAFGRLSAIWKRSQLNVNEIFMARNPPIHA